MQNNQAPGISWVKMERTEWGGTNDVEPGRCYLLHACRHCEDAPCVAVCPTGASAQREDGIVTIDYASCIGCWSCVNACPYDERVKNEVPETTHYFGTAEPAPYEGYGPQRTKVAEKCIFCHELVDQGLKPACVLNCAGGARSFGDIDDPESDVSKAIAGGAAKRIDNTAFYYVPVAGMADDLLPFAGNKLGGNAGIAVKPSEN
jgi:Fe-S-cluster-containing dehydrogenase component